MIFHILDYDFRNKVRFIFRDLTSIIKPYFDNQPHILEGYGFEIITWSRLTILNYKIVVLKIVVRIYIIIVDYN